MLSQSIIDDLETVVEPKLQELVPKRDPNSAKRYRIMYKGKQLVCYGNREWTTLGGAKLALRRQLIYKMRDELFITGWDNVYRGLTHKWKATGDVIQSDEYKDLEKSLLKHVYDNMVTIEEFT